MSEVKKYSHDERAAIIEEHRKWRFGEGGKRADLSRADLSSADLSSADLSRANLSSANLSSANLYRAKFNFQSHTLIAEVLRRAAGEDVEKRKVAGLILVSPDWCWDQFTANCSGDPLFGWALEVLRGYITEDDGHPAMLDKPVAGGVPL
jgi:hypothetical protein